MTADPRAALTKLVSALERHLEVATTRRDPDHTDVISAAEAMAEAFDDYDEALFEATDVATPLAVFGDDDVDADLDADRVYVGLDDDDIDFDDEDDLDDDADDDEDGADDDEDDDDAEDELEADDELDADDEDDEDD